MSTRRMIGAATVVSVFWVAPALMAGQSSGPQNPPAPPASSSHALTLAQGWAYLSTGDFSNAARSAMQVLSVEPRNIAALVLVVEAGIVGGGALTGLSAYEQWLGSRPIEDPYLIRRVAAAYLREALREPASRVEALRALAADGDADALAQLRTASASGRFSETTALAAMGDSRAVRALIGQLKTTPGNRANVINALSRSRSREAIPPLVELLDDPNDDTRAFAADALGKLEAVEAVEKLRRIVADQQIVYTPLKWKAAAALVRLKDATGLGFLRNILLSPDAAAHPELKVAVAADIAPFGSEREWIDEVRPLISHSDPQIRLNAATLLAPYDHDSARIALQGLLQDRNPGIRESAALTLATQVAGDFGTLRTLLRSADAASRTAAAVRILELTR